MYIVFISKFRQRTWLILRILLILLFLALLIPPLVNSLTDKNVTSSWFKEQRPTGNPMRVQNHKLEQIKETLQNYYNKN